MRRISVLFVCMGNICRSPTAEGVFRDLLDKEGLSDQVDVDSAGTHAYHIAEAPDRRAQSAALERGIDISMVRARRVDMADFDEFDYILVMDGQNYAYMAEICPKMFAYKLKYFLDFAPHLQTRDVPDPYYGGSNGFERVLDMIEDASAGLLEALRNTEL